MPSIATHFSPFRFTSSALFGVYSASTRFDPHGSDFKTAARDVQKAARVAYRVIARFRVCYNMSMNVTPAKWAANRANAQKSTGPRTEGGKSVSRLNRLRHGLRSELVVVPPLEDSEEWEEHRSAVAEVLAPQNYLEEQLADHAALATWRLRRAARYERGVLMQAQAEVENGGSAAEKLQHMLDDDDNRPRSPELAREQHALPVGLANGGDGLRHDELIVRYETAQERSLQRVIEGIRALRGLGSVGKKEPEP
ncbi:MAG TPA: hypothetical protein VMV82_11200 [Candidatus Dormibacteraeota bacterium]|nr:hypothetical protein [Candidatus Dormibacteraeota bacterium]